MTIAVMQKGEQMDDVNWIEVGKITESDGKTYRWLMCPHCGQVKLAGMDNSETIHVYEKEMRGDADD